MSTIKNIKCAKVLNSRGDWTIKTHLELDDGSLGWAIVPEGASKGENEAVSLDADRSIGVISSVISPELLGKEFKFQKEFDDFLINLDGTNNKSKLGGNSILSLSTSFARAVSQSKKKEVWSYLRDALVITSEPITPLFNVINGGKHARNNLSFQEFMLIPAKKFQIADSIEIGRTVYKSLKRRLEKDGFSTGVGDEGGFAPAGFTVRKALEYIRECAAENYKIGEDVFLGMDIAAESFYKNGKYVIAEENLELDGAEFKDYLGTLFKEFEIIYLEDPFYEKDVLQWHAASKEFGDKTMISADDLVVTHPDMLSHAIDEKLANTVIVKPNQVGTISETLKFVAMARKAGWGVVVSHRSGDTEDPFIADLAYAIGADFVKFGAPVRGERTAKFNRLLEISTSGL